MRIEQILTLLNAEDGIYHYDDKIMIKISSSVSIISADDNSSLINILKPEIKIASKSEKLNLVIPSAISKKYSKNELEKLSLKFKNGKSVEENVQKALVYLASKKEPLPDVNSMFSLASMLNGNHPGILTLKFAQWGGQGGMSGSEGGSFSNFSFQKGGDIDQFYGNGWKSQTMFDSVLDMARKNDKVAGGTSTEKKLENVGFYNHKYADENAMKYNLAWGERIKQKNLQRLRRMFQQRAEEKERDRQRSPEWLRTQAVIDPSHYTSPETALNARREGEDKGRDYRFQAILENTPQWHGKLPPVGPNLLTKRPNKVRWDTLRRYSSLDKQAVYNFESGSAPSRRGDPNDPNNLDPNYHGGGTGAFGAESRYMDQIVDRRETTENEPFGGNKDYLEQYPINKEHLGLFNWKETPNEENNSQGMSPTDKLPMFDFQTMTIEEALRRVREQERGLDPTDMHEGAENTTENWHMTENPDQLRVGPSKGGM